METGNKFQAHGQAFLNKCYDLNDEICLEHDLTITERGKKPEKRTMSEIKLKEKNEPVWKDEIRFAIDQTMKKKKLERITNFVILLKHSAFMLESWEKFYLRIDSTKKKSTIQQTRKGLRKGDDFT
nr:relaxase/mobilization nuclease domain-containing protein [Enterococcus faecium]